jgi:hypothetical protein
LKFTKSQDVTVQAADVVTPDNSVPADLLLSGGLIAFINEYDAVNGASLGRAGAHDPGDSLRYSLSDNGGGLFAVNEVTGQISVVGGLNFEKAASHQIRVRATDSAGEAIEQIFTINVGDQLSLNKRGKSRNDKLNGSNLDDQLKGGSGKGKDTIQGLAGDDRLYGESGADKLYGGDGIDRLYGGKDKDTLRGDAGDDWLYGEDGSDLLYGGAGFDTFVFNKKASKAKNYDTIKDFNVAEDKIWLENKIFKKLGKLGSEGAPAMLNKDFFVVGTKAKDKNDHLIYNKTKGVLYYDKDSSGKAKAVEITKINKKLALNFDDFFVI